MAKQREIFMVAGELSGDMIGSMLIKQLKRLDPSLKITGHGGEKMEREGAEILVNLPRDLAIIGFEKVVLNFRSILRVFRMTVDYLSTHRPDVVVLIDYPGFNLRIAKQAKKLGLKVVYYVCPQVWAWHKSRVKIMREYVDKALVILPFEEPFFRERGLEAEYVGTPWLDIMILTMTRDEVFDHFGFDKSKKLVGLLPGSRRSEVESLLPIMIEAAEKIADARPDVQFVIPRATTVKQETIEHFLTMSHVDIKVVDAYRYNVRAAMDVAIVVSGTATLETGLLGCPMAVIYKVNYISWMIGKSFIKIPYISLINFVAGDMVVPELIQDHCTPENISDRILKLLNETKEYERQKYQLTRIREKMGGPGASRRAANVVLGLINGSESEATQEPGSDASSETNQEK